jgi:hypothetical protein
MPDVKIREIENYSFVESSPKIMEGSELDMREGRVLACCRSKYRSRLRKGADSECNERTGPYR